MNELKARDLFEDAQEFSANEPEYAQEVKAAKQIVVPGTFENMPAEEFLHEYCMVVYASGFRVATVEDRFPKLKTAFHNFDLDKIHQMDLCGLGPALEVINNISKAKGFVDGCKQIAEEGFSQFKSRVRATVENRGKAGLIVLENLPYISSITKYHLAKNTGIADVPKPDLWLERAAGMCDTKVDELVEFLHEEYELSRHVVDLILWRYGESKNLGRPKKRRK